MVISIGRPILPFSYFQYYFNFHSPFLGVDKLLDEKIRRCVRVSVIISHFKHHHLNRMFGFLDQFPCDLKVLSIKNHLHILRWKTKRMWSVESGKWKKKQKSKDNFFHCFC